MFLPDVNFWLALAFPSHVHNQAARTWFDDPAKNPTCHFCRFTQTGFLRLANNPTAFPQDALTQDKVWTLFDGLVAHARVGFAVEPAGVEAVWRQFANLPQFSPNLWADAYIAAFARVGGYEVVTFDRAFTQFPNVRVTILP